MNMRTLTLLTLGATLAIGAITPALADDDWRWHERREQQWRQHQWRQHEWREHEAREHAWREQQWQQRNSPPPFSIAPVYPGFRQGYTGNQGYYR